jgi:hypothetical protein
MIMKRDNKEGHGVEDDVMGRPRELSQASGKADRGWEVFARQADREAQRYYEALAQVIRTSDEAMRNKRVGSVGRAYLARVVTEAKKALGKEFGLILRDDSEIPLALTSRSLN